MRTSSRENGEDELANATANNNNREGKVVYQQQYHYTGELCHFAGDLNFCLAIRMNENNQNVAL